MPIKFLLSGGGGGVGVFRRGDGTANFIFMRVVINNICGNVWQLKAQKEQIIYLTPKRLVRDFFLLLQRGSKSDQKVLV